MALQKVLNVLMAASTRFVKARRMLLNQDLVYSLAHVAAPSLFTRARSLALMVLLWPLKTLADVMMWRKVRCCLMTSFRREIPASAGKSVIQVAVMYEQSWRGGSRWD